MTLRILYTVVGGAAALALRFAVPQTLTTLLAGLAMHERCVWLYLIGIHNNEPQQTANEQLFIHELIQSHYWTHGRMDGEEGATLLLV